MYHSCCCAQYFVAFELSLAFFVFSELPCVPAIFWWLLSYSAIVHVSFLLLCAVLCCFCIFFCILCFFVLTLCPCNMLMAFIIFGNSSSIIFAVVPMQQGISLPKQQGISLQWNSEMNGTRTSSIFRRNLVLEMFLENVLLSVTFRSSVVDCFDLGFFNFSKFFALQLFFQDIYNRTWPTLMADRMSHQIEKLKHCEMGIVAFDDEFRKTHREVPLIRVVQICAGYLTCCVCARHRLVASVKSAHSSEEKFCLQFTSA